MAENELLDSKGRFLRRWQELCSSGVSVEEAAAVIAEEFGERMLKALNKDRRHRPFKQLLVAAAEGDSALRAAAVGKKPPELVTIVCQAIRACGEPRTPAKVAALAAFMLMDRVTDCLMGQAYQEASEAAGRSGPTREVLERHFELQRSAVEQQLKQALSGDWAGSPLRRQPAGTPMEVRAKAVLDTPLVSRNGVRRAH